MKHIFSINCLMAMLLSAVIFLKSSHGRLSMVAASMVWKSN